MIWTVYKMIEQFFNSKGYILNAEKLPGRELPINATALLISKLNNQKLTESDLHKIIKEEFEDELGRIAIRIKWDSSYSGQFDLWYGDESGPLFDYKKTIVVESLF